MMNFSQRKRLRSNGAAVSPRPVPPGSGLLGLLLLVRLLGRGDFVGAVQERAQSHPAEHVSVRLLDELHQLADVTVQTLGKEALV